jgi:Protein of unknown function (DUF4019)
MIRYLVGLTVLASSTSSAAEPKIVTKSVEGGYRIILSQFSGSDYSVAQAMIGPTVERLCGARTPQWGKFSIKTMLSSTKSRSLKPGRFDQEITCVDPVPQQAIAATEPFAATVADEQLAKSTALRFLSLRDAGDVDASFGMLSPSMRTMTDRKNWKSTVSALPTKVGKLVERRVVKVTWDVDPPGVDAAVYAAADFDGRSTGLAIHCGYVALKRQSNGEYLVVRIEEGNLAAKDAQGMTSEKILEMRAALQCRN